MNGDGLPPIDPEVAEPLAAVPAEILPVNLLDFDDVPASRERIDEEFDAFEPPASSEAVDTEDRTIPGPDAGQDLRLRIHRPVDGEGPLPCVYWIHGGGMVMGDAEGVDGTARRIVDDIDCVVVAVDYRLAPEHPYPAPVDDCYAGLRWVLAHADALDVDDSRVALAGESAGGGLAAAVALRAREEGGPSVCQQLLLCPMLDDRNRTTSSRQVADLGTWDRDTNERAWEAYLGELYGAADLPVDAAPGRVEDLSGLPPTYLDVGTHDLFRDETAAFATRAVACGVQTEFHLWPGCYHGYEGFAPDADVTRATWDARLRALRRAFDR